MCYTVVDKYLRQVITYNWLLHLNERTDGGGGKEGGQLAKSAWGDIYGTVVLHD